MEGPLDQDQGGRITVLHDGQIMQCSHCLRRADSCPGGGKGKLCRERKTRRGEIADYMRHLKLQHNYISLKMKFREEFPQLDSGRQQDGFEHMVESSDESPEKADDDILGNVAEETGKDEMILSLQKQLSEANQAREQGVHELAKLKSSIANQEVNMMIGMNKNKNSQINIRADNFQYDPESDMLQVLDEALLDKELEYHCTAAEEDKEKKIKEMKRRVLSQVKGIEREKRGRRSSISSVRSVNSGVGTVRKRSEEDVEENISKNIRTQPPSFLPKLK